MSASSPVSGHLPKFSLDGKVEFQGKTFDICRVLLVNDVEESMKHQFLSTTESNPYQIRSNVSPASVTTFLKPYQFLEPEITTENACDLLRLCEEFHSQGQRKEIDDWITANHKSMLLPVILRQVESEQDTSQREAELSETFPDYVHDDRLLDLPVELLSRVVRFPPESERIQFRQVLDFCLKVVDKRGPNASVLLLHLDPRALTTDDMEMIHQHRDFRWQFLGESIHETMNVLVNCIVQGRQLIAEEHARLSELQAQYQDLVGSADSKLHALEDTVAQLRALVVQRGVVVEELKQIIQQLLQRTEESEGAMKAVQRDLGRSAKADALAAAQREIELLKSELRELTSGCATKKELEQYRAEGAMTVRRQLATVALPYQYVTVPQVGESAMRPAFPICYCVNSAIGVTMADAFQLAGFTEVKTRTQFNVECGWPGGKSESDNCRHWQKVNHWPHASLIGTKSALHNRMMELTSAWICFFLPRVLSSARGRRSTCATMAGKQGLDRQTPGWGAWFQNSPSRFFAIRPASFRQRDCPGLHSAAISDSKSAIRSSTVCVGTHRRAASNLSA
jgi:hypothetical protein